MIFFFCGENRPKILSQVNKVTLLSLIFKLKVMLYRQHGKPES